MKKPFAHPVHKHNAHSSFTKQLPNPELGVLYLSVYKDNGCNSLAVKII